MAKCVSHMKWRSIVFSVAAVLFVLVGVTILITIAIGGSQNVETSLTGGAKLSKPLTPMSLPYSTSYHIDSAGQGRAVRHLRNRTRERGLSQTEIPTQASSGNEGTGSTTMKSLPVNAAQKHPVTLLYEMNLGPYFNVTHCTLNKKGVALQSFKATVTLAKINTTYGPAYGRNMRETKRRVAEVACLAVFNLTFTETVQPNPDQLLLHTSMCDT